MVEAVTLVCEFCGSEYQTRATNKGRYCGRSCADKAAYARDRESGRVRVPRERAEEAARIYSEAVAAGKAGATKAVAAQLGLSRSHASVMIRAARDLGLLGEALNGRAG
jgi:sRNA-binding protein